jgi:hypothetical protein
MGFAGAGEARGAWKCGHNKPPGRLGSETAGPVDASPVVLHGAATQLYAMMHWTQGQCVPSPGKVLVDESTHEAQREVP